MKPIIFQSEGICAILDGRKTQTRRIIKPQPIVKHSGLQNWFRYKGKDYAGECEFIDACPYGKVGDKLWVRETWKMPHSMDDLKPSCCGDFTPVEYLADNYIRFPTNSTDKIFGKIRPSIYMPRNVARIFLEITAIRVERVQDISEEDAKAEGVDCDRTHLEDFENLWNSIHGKGAWDKNEWVRVVEFKRIDSGT